MPECGSLEVLVHSCEEYERLCKRYAGEMSVSASVSFLAEVTMIWIACVTVSFVSM